MSGVADDNKEDVDNSSYGVDGLIYNEDNVVKDNVKAGLHLYQDDVGFEFD